MKSWLTTPPAVLAALLVVMFQPVAEAAGVRPVRGDGPGAARPALSDAERQQVGAAIAALGYHASASRSAAGEPALVARNRKQRYQTTFRPGAIEIDSFGDWRVGVSLHGFGREGAVEPLPAAEPRGERERVEYRRGPVLEWYVNGPEGLEQGFDVTEPPGNRATPLVLALGVEGNLDLAVEHDAARFSDDTGRTVVRYDGLRAWDAAGQILPAHLEAHGQELHLIVQAQDARFPVTVDPTFRHEAQLVAAGGTPGDEFGGALAISGNTLAVGALGNDTPGGANSGAVYVFVRSGTSWALQQKVTASDAAAGDEFGTSVALVGDTLLVGAPGDDVENQPDPDIVNAGSAYLFTRTGTTWTEQVQFVSTFAAAARRFGHAVALSSNTAVIGALNDERVQVLVGSGSSWSLQQNLTASGGLAQDRFGRAVAIFDDTILVGAPGRDTVSTTDNRGGAYVWVRNGGIWSPQAELGPLVPLQDGAFGTSVALDVDTAVAGTVPSANLGSADVFLRVGTLWIPQQRVQGADAVAADKFGSSVALKGDTLVVGAPADDTLLGVDAGSAYVFVRAGFGGSWVQQRRLAAKDAQAGDLFGSGVALDGDSAVVGASAGLATNAGSAYSYRLFGKGDVDRDGQTDLLVRQDNGLTEAWLMNGITRPGTPVAISPSAPFDVFVAGTDDFNSDLSTDLLVWTAATGSSEFWLMNGSNRIGAPVPLAGALPPPWKPSAIADFNNDGQPDIVYRNFVTQNITIWTMNGTTHTGAIVPVPGLAVDGNWEIVGAQDWNGDGDTDFLWYNQTSGKIVLWYMNASVARITGFFTNPPNAGDNNWKVLAMGDYGVGTGGLPGTIDLVWRNATSGKFVVWYMDQAGARTSGTFTTPDAPSPNPTLWTIVGPR